jgi:hypothetical protein
MADDDSKPELHPQIEEATDGSITFNLVKPIPVFKDSVHSIRFRKPTGEDLIRIGNPVEYDPYGVGATVRHDMGRMVAMMAALSGYPTSSFRHMDPNDMVSCAWALSPFFMPMRARQE